MRSYILKIVEFRRWVVFLTALITVGLLAQLKSLTVIIDPDSTLPQTHPYIATGNTVEKLFGNKFTVVIGVTALEGDIFQKEVLETVQNITRKLQASPLAVKANISSLSSRKSKNIVGTDEGMQVTPLMERVPETPDGMNQLKVALSKNPVFDNLLISKDQKSTQIVAEFKKSAGGFQAIRKEVDAAIQGESNSKIQINVAGLPIFLSLLEVYSGRMAFLFPLALLIIGLIHYEAFRTVQALILPLVTAMLAVAWSMGFLGLMGEPFDVFNASTPILILAIAAGHAVQILKRYYEEYAILRSKNSNGNRYDHSREAVINSLSKVGPVMLVACTVAALGFFSLMIFEIKSIRTFGIFSGMGVVSALILELTFIPALRVMLAPPSDREVFRESEFSFWDKVTGWFYKISTQRRDLIYLNVGALVLLLSLGAYWLKIDNSQKSYFYGTVQEKIADERVNRQLAGTNPFYVLVQGKEEDAIKRPDVLRFMDQLQQALQQDSDIGKTLSMADFIKKMNQAMNSDKPEFYSIPDNKDLIAQYLLLYSNSGEPGDFDSYVDYNYQNAVVNVFSKSDSSAFLDEKIKFIQNFSSKNKPADIDVSIGGGSLGGVALNEIMIREKILNIAQIMGAVFIVSSLVFRSLLAGTLILVPLVAAVSVNFGVMGLLGIPLQVATALVSAMAVGIGADYAIYMSYRMREELRNKSLSEDQAIEKSFKSAGKAAIFVSTAVAGGFGLLMLSWGFMIHMWMGFLIALAMLVSSVTALTVLPSLIFSLRPKYIFEERK